MVEIRNFAKEIFNKNPLVYDSGEKCTLLLFTQVEKTAFDDFCNLCMCKYANLKKTVSWDSLITY